MIFLPERSNNHLFINKSCSHISNSLTNDFKMCVGNRSEILLIYSTISILDNSKYNPLWHMCINFNKISYLKTEHGRSVRIVSL